MTIYTCERCGEVWEGGHICSVNYNLVAETREQLESRISHLEAAAACVVTEYQGESVHKDGLDGAVNDLAEALRGTHW